MKRSGTVCASVATRSKKSNAASRSPGQPVRKFCSGIETPRPRCLVFLRAQPPLDVLHRRHCSGLRLGVHIRWSRRSPTLSAQGQHELVEDVHQFGQRSRTVACGEQPELVLGADLRHPNVLSATCVHLGRNAVGRGSTMGRASGRDSKSWASCCYRATANGPWLPSFPPPPDTHRRGTG